MFRLGLVCLPALMVFAPPSVAANFDPLLVSDLQRPDDIVRLRAPLDVDGDLAVVVADEFAPSAARVIVYNTVTGEIVSEITPGAMPTNQAKVAIDNEVVVIGETFFNGNDGSAVALYNAETGALIRRIENNNPRFGGSVDIEGNTLVVGASGLQPGNTDSAWVFDVDKAAVRTRIGVASAVGASNPFDVELSPDTEKLLVSRIAGAGPVPQTIVYDISELGPGVVGVPPSEITPVDGLELTRLTGQSNTLNGATNSALNDNFFASTFIPTRGRADVAIYDFSGNEIGNLSFPTDFALIEDGSDGPLTLFNIETTNELLFVGATNIFGSGLFVYDASSFDLLGSFLTEGSGFLIDEDSTLPATFAAPVSLASFSALSTLAEPPFNFTGSFAVSEDRIFALGSNGAQSITFQAGATPPPAAIPLPASMPLLLGGLMALGYWKRRTTG